MAIVEARKRIGSKTYEISVDFEEAMKVKEGNGDISVALNSNGIYYNAKKGESVSQSDLESDFETTDVFEVAKKIIQTGEIQKPQEYRNAEKEKKIKQVINLILRNAVDQHGNPYTEERIRRAIEEIHYNFDNRPAEQQMNAVIMKLKPIIPISVHIKKLKLKIPAQYTGQIYGLLKDYKQSEEWLGNGDLEVIVNIPAGMQIDFYEKLNGVTHGSIQSEEIGE